MFKIYIGYDDFEATLSRSGVIYEKSFVLTKILLSHSHTSASFISRYVFFVLHGALLSVVLIIAYRKYELRA